MIYTLGSPYEGEGRRLYRTPGEIRRDIIEARMRIQQIDSKLNVRQLIADMMTDAAEGAEPSVSDVSAVEDCCEEARLGLVELYEVISDLGREMEESKWLFST